jgi:hypothetical protein
MPGGSATADKPSATLPEQNKRRIVRIKSQDLTQKNRKHVLDGQVGDRVDQ